MELPQHARRDARPRDAVEPVAAGDDVARELVLVALVARSGRGPLAVEVVERDVADFEGSGRPLSSRAAIRSLTTSVCP